MKELLVILMQIVFPLNFWGDGRETEELSSGRDPSQGIKISGFILLFYGISSPSFELKISPGPLLLSWNLSGLI